MKSTSTSAALALMAPFLLLSVDRAIGAEPGDDKLAEVLVTASKRGEVSLLDTPMSIQALTGDQIEAQGIRQFADYARTISGLAFEDQGPGDKKIVLRGVQSVGAGTTGLYFDDVVVTSNHRQDGGGRQPDFRLIDMERVEVLKGPQGTLYGASSMSGTIRMLTNKPNASKIAMGFNGGTGSTEGADGLSYDFDGFLNLPLVQDKLAIRLVGYSSELGGYIDDQLLGRNNVNSQRVSGGRVALRWNLSDAATLDVMAVRQKTSSNGAAYFQPIFGEFVQRNTTSSQWDESMDAYNVALNWTLGHGTVTASTSYLDRDILYRYPGARIFCSIFGGPGAGCFDPDPAILDQWRVSADQPQSRGISSSELRYASNWQGPFQLVGGVFYQTENNQFRSEQFDQDANGDRIAGRLPRLLRTVDTDIKQKAIFAEGSYNIFGGLTATVGARAFRFNVNERGQNRVTQTRPIAQAPVFTESTDEDVTLKGNLQYKFASGPIVYATYSEGFRSGGNNEPDFATGTELPPYKSDSLKSYEIGSKGQFYDGRLQLDGAIYLMNWKDLQARISAGIPNSTALKVGNVGAAEIKGVEIGALAQPFSKLSIGGNLTLLEAKLSEDGPAGFTGRDGDRLPNVPEFSTNLFTEYAFPVGGLVATARAEYSYVGDSYSDFNKTRPIYNRQGDYSLVNLRMTFGRDHYTFSGYLDNAFNELGWINSSIDVRRPVEVFATRPRTFGVSFGYTF